MSTSENKAAPTPFKTMDIKSAFLAAGNRKRKASSPTALKNQEKSLKLACDKSEDDIEIISVVKNAAIIGECKENKDINSLQNTSQIKDISANENILQDKKDENVDNVAKPDENVDNVAKPDENVDNVAKPDENVDNVAKPDEILDDENNSSESSSNEGSLKASSSELNSTLNDSINVLQTSELSESLENQNKSEKDLNSSIDSKLATSTNSKKIKITNPTDARPKKKRKMTPDEAAARSQGREEKQKQRLLKKQELEAQKLAKQKEKERRQIEKEMRAAEKEKERLEKEEERKEKERLKQEKKDQEEKERLQKLKEKEEQKKQKQMMLEMKQEEKKKKEEQRLKREEEMKKAEEEKQKAKIEKEQKEKEKKEKAKAAFMKFFKKEDPTNTPPAPQPIEKEGVFKPFQVSDNMVLAHVVQPAAQERFNKCQLDKALQLQDAKELYVQLLKSGCYKDVRQRKRLRKQRTCDADIILVDKSEQEQLWFTAKLLQFTENVRPPYWGTWRKQSRKISPRNPFAQDEIFDYSVDSDEEWDEGGPGESLSGTENEQESEDDYEVDNEFFVPHGYLSSEEEKEKDEEATNDPEKQKALLKIKQQEFESERKKKTTELKPMILGCYFENLSEPQDAGLKSILTTYSAELLSDTPIPTRFTIKKILADAKLASGVDSPSNGTPTSNKQMKIVPEEAMPHLIRLLHGNTNNKEFIVREFQAFWQQHTPSVSQPNTSLQEIETDPNKPGTPTENNVSDPIIISKRQLILTLKKISEYGKNPVLKKSCWSVKDEVRGKYGLLDLPMPNEWNYITSKDEVEVSPVVKKTLIQSGS